MTTKTSNKHKTKPMAYDALLAAVLPCPFCGENPQFEKGYVPAYIEFMCLNDACHVQPHLEVRVSCKRNEGETETYSPQFEQHYKELLDKWNNRP
jgi:hypothetical protein